MTTHRYTGASFEIGVTGDRQVRLIMRGPDGQERATISGSLDEMRKLATVLTEALDRVQRKGLDDG